MQTAQQRFREHECTRRQSTSGFTLRDLRHSCGGPGTPGPSALLWAPAVVMSRPRFRIERRCVSDIGIIQSRHSRRIVQITRSQIALALGLATATARAPRPGLESNHPGASRRATPFNPEATGRASSQTQFLRSSGLARFELPVQTVTRYELGRRLQDSSPDRHFDPAQRAGARGPGDAIEPA